MVIGSGLIGSTFEKSQHEFKDVCVYASGVSNSNSSDCYEFKREQDQLVYFLSKYRHLRRFYFISTCSLYDSERNTSPYVKHKLKMENLVISNTNGVIIRLPQVVGRSTNPHTLTNFIYLSIKNQKPFALWKKAKRNLIDVDDVVKIVAALDVVDIRQPIFNVANVANYKILDIVTEFEKIIGLKGIFKTVDCGSEYEIDISDLSMLPFDVQSIFNEHYLANLLRKYY